MEYWHSIYGNLDFHRWKSRFSWFLFNDEIDGVKICFTLSPSGDLNEAASFKLLDKAVYAGDAHADIFGQTVLPWEAQVVVPSVTEQQGIDRFCANGDG